jgi:hypothetical protein
VNFISRQIQGLVSCTTVNAAFYRFGLCDLVSQNVLEGFGD